MTTDDTQEFFVRLMGLAELFDATFSEAKSLLYFEALRDVSLEQVLGAMNEAVKVCRFMPRPAELRELAVGNQADRVERAWLMWKDAARQIGQYSSWDCRDAVLAETLVAVFGGWPEACTIELSAEMWIAKRKEFGRVYGVLADRAPDGHGSKRLAGWCERDNQARGYLEPTDEHPQLEQQGP